MAQLVTTCGQVAWCMLGQDRRYYLIITQHAYTAVYMEHVALRACMFKSFLTSSFIHISEEEVQVDLADASALLTTMPVWGALLRLYLIDQHACTPAVHTPFPRQASKLSKINPSLSRQ